jgi:beta-1,4-N-acetylglucosaminyltransferase
VGFQALTASVLDVAFWSVLQKRGFTSLRIQCGPDIAWASKQLDAQSNDVPSGFNVDVFERTSNLMKDEMVLCKAADGRKQGLVISHAGSSPAATLSHCD